MAAAAIADPLPPFPFSSSLPALRARLVDFMNTEVYPAEPVYAQQHAALAASGHRWATPAIVESLKSKARAQGLWNLFLPSGGESMGAPGLTNLDYAPLAEIMGGVPWASEVFNCNAPDTGNIPHLPPPTPPYPALPPPTPLHPTRPRPAPPRPTQPPLSPTLPHPDPPDPIPPYPTLPRPAPPHSTPPYPTPPHPTGNMEVLARYGDASQRERWLGRLLRGEIRSAFCMTEPAVASSDATNISLEVRRVGGGGRAAGGGTAAAGYYELNGRKWWSSGVLDPRCELLIVMGRVADAHNHPPHRRHSMLLVPRDATGVTVERQVSHTQVSHTRKSHTIQISHDPTLTLSHVLPTRHAHACPRATRMFSP